MLHRRGLTTPLILALVVALGATACTEGPSPEELAASEADEARFAACLDIAEDITAALQSYVDQFAPEFDGGLDTAVPSLDDLQAAAEAFSRRRAAAGCRPREFQLLLDRTLADLEGEGSLGAAVAARVRDQVAPLSGPAAGVTVAPGDDLAAAVHGADPGAVIRLEAGRHELAEPLVLLRETRLVGAGAGETTIASVAPGVALLHAGEDRLTLEGLTLAHEGDEPASVLVSPGGTSDLRDVAVRGGVADEAGSTGWGLVLGGAAAPGDPADESSITALVTAGNAAGGIGVTGGAPRLSDITATDNGGCGICWLESAGGTLTGAELVGNGVGLSLSGTADPVVEDLVASDNEQAGVLVEATTGGGRFTDVVLTGNGPSGLVVRGAATTSIQDLVSEQHDQSGVVVEGEGAPTMSGVEISDAAIGVLVRDNAAPVLSGFVVRAVIEAHVVFTDDTAGSIRDATCDAAPVGVALLGSTMVEVTGPGCGVVDQRDG